MRVGLKRGLLVSVLLPGAALAQGRAGTDLPVIDEIQVVAPTPVGGAGAAGGIERAKVPSTVETVTGRDFTADRGRFDVLQTFERRVPSVNLSDSQGNSNRQSLTYRGFEASPVQGTPQGLAVYQNGARINEAFGDVVNWDLIPQVAINRVDFFTGNPVFGLNALGGAVNIEMKNGFTWQGNELTMLGGSDGRIAGTLQHGSVIGPWSFYFAGEGLRDKGWRFDSPSEIGRVYADVGYRSQDSEFHVIASGAKTFFGAAAATPVDLLRLDPRAIYTSPQTTSTELGQLQLTGKVDVGPTWTLQGNAYLRRLSQTYVDGNPGDFERCSPTGTDYGNRLCLEDDGFTRPPGGNNNPTVRAFRNQFVIVGPNGQTIPYVAGTPYATLDRTQTEATSFGGALQAMNTDRLFDHTNRFIVGGSIDHADYSFSSTSTLGYLLPDLTVTTNPNVPGVGLVPGLGTGPIRTLGSLGYAPTRLDGTNTYFGLFATDTFDVTDRLSLTAGARLNVAKIRTFDRSGTASELNGDHTFTRLNPNAGLTFRLTPGLSLYGGYSESNRAPTPLELSCADPSRPCLLANSLVADPPLKQVVGHTYEAGLRGTGPDLVPGGALNWKLGAYRTDITNDILSLASAIQGRGYYTNVPATRRQGIEVSAEYVTDRLSLYANYALVDATFQFSGLLASPNNPAADSDGNILVRRGNVVPLVPTHQIKAGFDYAITPQWRLGLNASAFSSSYYRGDESNLNRKLPAYAVVNLTTSYQVTENIQLFGLATNLLNHRYATFGTYAETGLIANTFQVIDPRTVVLAQPLSIYGGLRVTW